MFYFSITSLQHPYRDFVSAWTEGFLSFFVAAQCSLSLSGVWSLQDVTDMDDLPWQSFALMSPGHDLLPIWILKKASPYILGSEPESRHVAKLINVTIG